MIIAYLSMLVAILVSIPLWVVTAESLLALFLKKTPTKFDNHTEVPHFSIIIPAHNEASILSASLSSLLTEIENPASIFLIADNCTDDTANIARSFGVNVLERNDLSHRGKGFALAFGLDHIRKQKVLPEVIVLLDADCEIKKTSITELVNAVIENNRPAQAIYLMKVAENASIKQRIAGFAWLVKNKVRPLAVNALSIPVTLTGTGMAFPLKVFDYVHLAHGNIVEDMQLGIDCAIQGYPPLLCVSAEVFSYFPEQQHAEVTQRTRWEHGHLQTIIQQCPILMKKALLSGNWRLIGLALDIAVPPLSLLILISFSALLALIVLLPFGANLIALGILLFSFTIFSVLIICVWQRHGLDYLSVKELFTIPSYILSKLSIYSAFIIKRQKTWVRTDRN